MTSNTSPTLSKPRPSGGLRRALALLATTGMALCAQANPSVAGPAATMAPPTAAHASMPGAHTKKKPAAPVKLVDINSAGVAELMTLPGVGDAEAAKIVAGRPYLSKAELVTKKVMPAGPYLSLKNRVVAMQKKPPKRAA